MELQDGGAAYDLDKLATLCRVCHAAEHRREPTPEQAAWRDLVKDEDVPPLGCMHHLARGTVRWTAVNSYRRVC